VDPANETLHKRVRRAEDEASKGTMNVAFQHYFNPLHLYCRLRSLGFPKDVARFLCRFYERVIFRYVSPEVRNKE
jgi:hypothetical protein